MPLGGCWGCVGGGCWWLRGPDPPQQRCSRTRRWPWRGVCTCSLWGESGPRSVINRRLPKDSQLLTRLAVRPREHGGAAALGKGARGAGAAGRLGAGAGGARGEQLQRRAGSSEQGRRKSEPLSLRREVHVAGGSCAAGRGEGFALAVAGYRFIQEWC